MTAPTILVVEDDPIQREGMRSAFEKAGYRVELAANPSEALAWLSNPAPQTVILLDMLFPRSQDGDGWHFLARRQQLRHLHGVPVVITTALGNASPEWAEALGAQGFLRKPIDVDVLLAEVRRFV